MHGAGRSESPAVSATGALVGLIAVVGYLISDWSFSGSKSTNPTALGTIVAVVAIGWTVYSRVNPGEGL